MKPHPTAQLVTSLEELAPLEDDWRALAVERGNPQLTPDFFGAWVRNNDRQIRPYVPVLLGETGRLRGLLPLVITTDPWRNVHVAGAAAFWIHVVPVARRDDEVEVAAAVGRLLASQRAWGAVTLDHVEPGVPWVEALVGALASDHDRMLRRRQIDQRWLVADVGSGWDAYLAGRPGKVRSELRRLERRAAENGISVRTSADIETFQADLETLFRLHLARHESLGPESTYRDPALRGALEEFANEAFRRGWAHLRVLEQDGDVVAANLSVWIGGRCVGYLMGWDERGERSGIGRLALVDTMRAALEAGVREIDFGIGWTEFKARHATERPVLTLSLYPWRTAVRLAAQDTRRRLHPVAVRDSLARLARRAAGRLGLLR